RLCGDAARRRRTPGGGRQRHDLSAFRGQRGAVPGAGSHHAWPPGRNPRPVAHVRPADPNRARTLRRLVRHRHLRHPATRRRAPRHIRGRALSEVGRILLPRGRRAGGGGDELVARAGHSSRRNPAHGARALSPTGGRARPPRHHLARFVRPFRAPRRRRHDANAHRHPARAAEHVMTIPAQNHRNARTPVADAATSTSLAHDRKPVAPGSESTEDKAPPTKHERGVLDTAHVGTSTTYQGVRRRLLVVALLAAAAGAGVAGWWFTHRNSASAELVLYGNVDLRQVALPFNNNERIAAVLVQEGDRVHKGEVLARLDTSRLEPQGAQVAAQRAVVDRLRKGSRPEEIAQAKANLESAKADAVNARRQFERKKSLLGKNFASQQDADAAEAAASVADARVEVNQKALDLAIAGPRQEDIDQAEAQLGGNEAQLAFLRQHLPDAHLKP